MSGSASAFGYRRLHTLLRRMGLRINLKRVYRLYRQEGLAVRRRPRKRIRRPQGGEADDSAGLDEAKPALGWSPVTSTVMASRSSSASMVSTSWSWTWRAQLSASLRGSSSSSATSTATGSSTSSCSTSTARSSPSWAGDGAGSFTASASLPAEPGTRDLELRDLDGDERLDALLRDRLRGGLTFAAGDGGGGFAPARAVELSDDSVSGAGLLAGPFNAGSGLASVTLAVGSFRTWCYGSSFTHAGFLDRPASDNARFDLIGQGFVAGERSVALIAPQTGPAPIIIGETVLSHRAMGLSSADFNGDGLGDLAIVHVDCKVSILDGLGDISFADALPGPAFDLCPTTLRAADVDHDGDVDLLGHHDSDGLHRLTVLLLSPPSRT